MLAKFKFLQPKPKKAPPKKLKGICAIKNLYRVETRSHGDHKVFWVSEEDSKKIIGVESTSIGVESTSIKFVKVTPYDYRIVGSIFYDEKEFIPEHLRLNQDTHTSWVVVELDDININVGNVISVADTPRKWLLYGHLPQEPEINNDHIKSDEKPINW